MSRDYITIVRGFRSGTSLLMQMLAAGKGPHLTDHVCSADEEQTPFHRLSETP